METNKVTKKDVKSALEKAGMGERVRIYYPDGFVGKIVYNNWKGTYRLEDIKGGLLDEFSNINSASSAIYGEIANGGSIKIFDSKRIKDADDAPDVLDGILLIAFEDGEEENGYNEVKSHANEQGEVGGVKYETYDADNQDGVALIDLCALTDDANAFVKALLNEWGIIDIVADIEFEASDNMKGEVSDSHRVSDMTKPVHLRGYAEKYRKKRREQRENLGRVENVDEIDEETDRDNISDSRDARFFVYKNQQDVTPDKEGFVKKADAIAFAKTMVDDDDRTMVEVYRYDENDEWGNVEQTVWTSNNQPKTDLEYWGVRETTIKKLKTNEWFTLKPIPEPSESQVWTKLFYNREDRTYTCERYDGGGERYFKGDKKVYVGFTF